MNEKELIPLWDCDLVAYRCGFAADSQIKAEAKVHEPDAGPERLMEMLDSVDYIDNALQNVKTVFEAVNDRFCTEKARYFIDGPNNFRYSLATLRPYKGNRDKAHKPKYYKEIKEYILDIWKAEEVEDIETDDRLGIIQCSSPPDSTVIVSMDKDMLQIPGHHFNWVKNELQYVTPDDADLMLFWQMLVGDTSDNIPGIEGIGPVRASKIIADAQSLDAVRDAVKALYRKQYGDLWELAYNEVGALLYIRRTEEAQCPLL